MSLRLAEWPDGNDAALIFMVDDLANIYFKDIKGDWGGRQNQAGGMYDFIRKNILNEFPYVKLTFFLVTGEREVQSEGSYDFVSSCDQGSFPLFLESIISEGHEVAYHGLKHGTVVDGKFVQEWTGFKSLAEAIETIEIGRGLYETAVGTPFKGGKYCGYECGGFGHSSINMSKFMYWFDKWDENHRFRVLGEIVDDVVYLPSNIDCSRYSLNQIFKVNLGKWFKSQVRSIKSGTNLSKIKDIIKLGGVISLQEHTSPVRTDGRTQYPNLFDDIKEIRFLLSEIKHYSIWYATAGEVAAYLKLKKFLRLEKNHNSFWVHLDLDYIEDIDFRVTLTIDLLDCSFKSLDEQNLQYRIKDGIVYINIRVDDFGKRFTYAG